MYKLLAYSIGLLCMTNAYSQTTIIGNSTFDFQSYYANHNRVIAYGDGTVSAAWVGSDGYAAAFNDRGMFYNHYNGAAWGAFPDTRIETQKTYFGELLSVMSHEMIVSDDVSKIRVYANTAAGATDWTQTAGSNVINGYNPMAFCPQGTDDIYVINTKKLTYESLLFSRSDDGGATWAVLEYALPFTEEAYGIDLVYPDAYQIVAKGNDVYVLYGGTSSDLILMHSGSKGAPGTWELTATLVDFHIDNYTSSGMTTDWNGDGVIDTIQTTDAMHEMFIQNDGTVHVFSGRMKVFDPTNASGLYYLPETGGIWHWKTGMASATLINTVIDWNNDDGTNDPFGDIGSDFTAYYAESFTCMPTAAYDASINRIYLVYMMPIEFAISASNQTRYDLFGIYSDNGGVTWTSPINLTYTAHAGQENAFPTAYAKVVDGKVHVEWQQDLEPGTSQDSPADVIVNNNIRYAAWDSTRFQPYDPTVAFTYTLVPFGGVFNATFTNLSVDAESYYWTFGDGGTSTLTNPTHTYAPGSYAACLTGYNVYGSATVCQTIVASNEPVADFTFIGDPTVAFIDLSTGDPTSWSWTFGDGGTSTLSDPTHTYMTNGVFNACLTVSNVAGSDTHCESVTIDSYLAPTAYFTYSGDPTVTFTDLSLGSPTSWAWTFGDGGTSTLQNPVHTYTTNGTYNVCLTATNALGSNTTCQDIVIDSYLSPTAAFSYTGDPVVTFTDLSTNSPTSWAWTFGDGGTSTLQNPVHTYTTNGTYNVCLTATNLAGSNTHCEMVVIEGYAAPVALFDYAGDPVVAFTDLSTGSPTSWVWDFGDGAVSTLENPSHMYISNGSYTVCLNVAGPGGADEECKTINITNGAAAPTANFSANLNGTLTVTFTDLSTNSPTDWAWDFGDGAISGLQNPAHSYATEGDYTVCLTASNGIGEDTYCDVIAVNVGIFDNPINLLNIYPNPAIDHILIALPENINDYTLEIFNAVGQKMNCTISAVKNTIDVQVHTLPAGTYYVRVLSDKTEQVGKFIIE